MSTFRLSTAARLQKLRAMSPAEIAWRVRYKAAIAQERRRYRRDGDAPADRLGRALLPAYTGHDWQRRLLESRHSQGAAGIFASLSDRDALAATLEQRYVAELSDMRQKAADARAHRFTFFGETFAYGDDIPWQTDPVTRRPWPSTYHADVRVHAGDVGCGDVKHVWELSRQQYLVDLGKAAYVDRDADSVAAIRRLVRGWMAGNPYATGVNWSCALEPAFRSFSWLWAYALALPDLDEAFHVEWLTGFYDHARFIERHLERYSSPFNHLIGEAAALFMIGASFPELRDASRWQATARDVLEHRLDEQFYADGGSVEQSTFYHHATVGYYLLAALTAQRIGAPLSDRVMAAIERGLAFSLAMMQPDGRTPEIGGADDGKPIRMEHLPFWDFRPYLAIGAVLFDRGDFKYAAGRFHEDALWLLGVEGLEAFERIEPRPPTETSTALPASGYFVLRSDWSATADYVCMDAGEQAAGMRQDAIANAMHGHADALSIVAWLGGERVLVDSGLYAYNCGGDWEAHFRETAAHNTVRVDGRDQARHLGKMNWSHSYRTAQEGWAAGSDGGWVLGSHDGYARGDLPVTHRRFVHVRFGAYLLICDELTGAPPHQLEVNYQFAPGTPLTTGDGRADHGRVTATWAGTGAWSHEVIEGGPSPGDGWIAPSLGLRVAAPRLRLRHEMQTPRVVLAVVLTLPDVDVTVQHDTSDTPALVVRGDAWCDLVVTTAPLGATTVSVEAPTR